MATEIKFSGKKVNKMASLDDVKARIATRYKQEYHSALLGLPKTESEYSFTGDFVTLERINRNGQNYPVDCPVFAIKGQTDYVALNFSDLAAHDGYAADDDSEVHFDGLIENVDGESPSERNERVVEALYKVKNNKTTKVTFKASVSTMRNGTNSYNRKLLVLSIDKNSISYK